MCASVAAYRLVGSISCRLGRRAASHHPACAALGSGELLLHAIDMSALGCECVTNFAGERAARVFLRKRQ